MSSIASLQHMQLESSLLGLPAEIKHIIYGLCFDNTRPILDPIVGGPRDATASLPMGGLALLQTCRRVHLEADRRPLYARNTFRFTTADNARAFFKSLDSFYSTSIRDVCIDVSKVRSDCSDVARDWLQYLSSDAGPGTDARRTLSIDAPCLDTLRLNFESWPCVAMSRPDLWKLLRNMLSEAEGLKRIVLVGSSKGPSMARRDPWSSVHFIGSDDVMYGELIPWMWGCVKGSSENKIIRWVRADGRLNLEVVSKAYIRENEGTIGEAPSTRRIRDQPWPENGSCTLDQYMDRDLHASDATNKEISPNDAV